MTVAFLLHSRPHVMCHKKSIVFPKILPHMLLFRYHMSDQKRYHLD